MSPIGSDNVLAPNGSGESEIIGDRRFTLRVNYYGFNAVSNLEGLYLATNKIENIRDFDLSGLVIVDMINCNDITIPVDSKFEERASSDWLCRTTSILVDSDVGLIEHVEIDGTLKNDDVVNREIQITVN